MIKQKKFNRKVKLFLTASTLMGVFALENKSFSAAFDHSTDHTENTYQKRLRENLESTTLIEEHNQQISEEQQSNISGTDSLQAQRENKEKEAEHLRSLCAKYTPYLNNELENYLKNPPIKLTFADLPYDLTLHIFSFCSKIGITDDLNQSNTFSFGFRLTQNTSQGSLYTTLSSNAIKANFFTFKKEGKREDRKKYALTNEIVFYCSNYINILNDFYNINFKTLFNRFKKTLNTITFIFDEENGLDPFLDYLNSIKKYFATAPNFALEIRTPLNESKMRDLSSGFTSLKTLSLQFDTPNTIGGFNDSNKFLFNLIFPNLKNLTFTRSFTPNKEDLERFLKNHNLKSIKISHSYLSKDGYEYLFIFSNQNNIKCLSLNPIGYNEDESLKMLINSNVNQHSFTKLSLSRNRESQGFFSQTLQTLLNQQKNLKILKLTGEVNPIPNDFLPILAEKINTQESKLGSLSLRGNKFSVEALINFAQSIKENKTLYSLCISNSDDIYNFSLGDKIIGDKIIREFIKNISENNTLKYLTVGPSSKIRGIYNYLTPLSADLIEWLSSEAFQAALMEKRGGVPLTIYGLR